MYFDKTNINTSRLSLARLSRRAVAVAPAWLAGSPLTAPRHSRHQERTGSRQPRQGALARRAANPAAAVCLGQSAQRAADAGVRGVQAARPAAEISVVREILRSAGIGVVACLALLWLAGGSPLSFFAVLIWSSGFGALIGILLWVSSVEAPEDPVLPPSPEQRRGEKTAGPSRRR